MKGVWSKHIDQLTRAMRRAGWKVVRGEHATLAGQCDYDARTIGLFEPNARDAFMTLCHEDGHRRAFLDFQEFGARTDKLFTAMCPVRSFREYQACVYGWQTLRRYTRAITLKEWLDFNSDCLTLAVEYGGAR